MRSEMLTGLPAGDRQALRNLNLLTQGRERLSDWRQRRLGLRGTLIFLLSAPLAFAAVVALTAATARERAIAPAAHTPAPQFQNPSYHPMTGDE